MSGKSEQKKEEADASTHHVVFASAQFKEPVFGSSSPGLQSVVDIWKLAKLLLTETCGEQQTDARRDYDVTVANLRKAVREMALEQALTTRKRVEVRWRQLSMHAEPFAFHPLLFRCMPVSLSCRAQPSL
jgi:hypothetical protein